MTTGRTHAAPDEQLSGRELDAAVAERVMGWTVIRDAGRPDWFDSIAPERFPVLAMFPAGGTSFHVSAFNYDVEDFKPSESIEAAMCVVERLAALHWQAHISRHLIAPYWQVELYAHEGDTWTRKMAESDSLPEAICLAALKAVQEKKG